MKQSSITSSPPPLPLRPSTPILTHIDKNLKKQIDEREKLFLLYENEGKLSDIIYDTNQQQTPRLSTTDPNSIDHYGFIRDQPIKSLTINERKQIQQEIKRSERWNKMLKKTNHTITRDNEQLRRRMFKGLPSTLRGAFWSRLFDLDEQLRVNKGYYDILKKKARLSSTYLSQIDLDVHRTYRNHQMFCNRYCLRQKHLFSILAAYSVYNTEIGYTQGMNQIVAFLLFYLPEEEAFWAFCQLMTSSRWMMHGFFCPGFPKLFRFQAQFEKIMKKMLPKVYKHFITYQVQSDLYTIRWFMLCYLDCLPFPLTLRIWDIFVLDGEQVLLTTAFCILRIHRKKLLHLKNFDSINSFLKNDLCYNFSNSSLTTDEIIEEYIVCYEKLKQNNLLILPPPTENELPTKPFNISMGDITKLTNNNTIKNITATSDETKPITITTTTTTTNKNNTSSRIITTEMSPKSVPIPIIETYLVSSSAPLATVDDDSPSIVNLRDTSIENQYIEIKRLTKPYQINDQQYLTEYDSCTILSSADPSLSGYKQRYEHNDDDTISSKSDIIDADEHIQISHMITTSFIHDSRIDKLRRTSSFYDNVIDDEQFNYPYIRSQHYAFETDIR
ncbi:unnamed protein product [Rotaria sp. Silwood1]|nr:unnamed protein product [Rotaria sp. Silwood1]CAF1208953.1 unnamed protein product [Rotaria sp. Silwood1]CAF3440959.1 unnamed protein product [Rotaria sp. Silwood1]CAF3485801.1 unnamed protein product [Rotaria sp. Silwood1]CAF4690572.1 unnamed protein product [Rotaria sp. Silwood1]